jgi:pyrroline-5-carboxylate reductase
MEHRLGIIGGGNMGFAIARGAIAAHLIRAAQVVVAEIDEEKRRDLARLGCATTADARIATSAEQVLLAVKPQSFAVVAKAIAPLARPTVVISIMAGVETPAIRRSLGAHARVIRAMPNTPCQLGDGMTGVALGDGARPGDETLTLHVFEALGRTAIVPEALMDAVTAVSGSGPAYVYLLAELMEKAAMQIGLDEATARLLVQQTIIGAGRMMRASPHEPEELRRIVTTPAGTTAAAVKVMMDRGLPSIVIDALVAARDRGRTLARETS